MSKYKLVCFDVDGTLVDNVTFSWELFHNYFEVDMKKRDEMRAKFFKGEIDYLQWANHDIGMWIEKKATKKDFLKAMKDLKLMQGALETIKELKKHNIKLAIISGSLDIILEKVLPNYKEFFDDVFLSHLIFDKNEKLIGAKVTQYDMMKKAEALRKIAKRENIDLKETVHIGDHHNDVEIAKIAGLSIAFDCKDNELRKVADIEIKKKDLREVLKNII
ncbi:MAG: HAD family phosphatase [Nanoarchaeota archaeon]|nr:HAD family phosphatase [Nanoarchaeota archaeon]MBU1946995.1 HAD family phosphatase [Nanoarchaeota archaeon]